MLVRALRFYGITAASYAALATICLQFPIYPTWEMNHRVQYYVLCVAITGAAAMVWSLVLAKRLKD